MRRPTDKGVVGAAFRNITHHVTPEVIAGATRLFQDVLELGVAFARPGHIACFELAGFDVAVCVHEAETDRPPGTTELTFGHSAPETIGPEVAVDPDGRRVRLQRVEPVAPVERASGDPEFLNVTLYTNDFDAAVALYRDLLGMVPDYEERGHLCAMGHVCVHDASEGPAGTARLYFLADDAQEYAIRASERGVPGEVRADGYGRPAWQAASTDLLSVVVLTRGKVEK